MSNTLASLITSKLLGAFDLRFYLAGAKQNAFPHIDQIPSTPTPIFVGNPDEFVTSKGEDSERYRYQMKNKVKKCPNCKKAVAYTLLRCNGCGEHLTSDISYTNNVFTGFCYGIAKGPFPFTISTRFTSPDVLVFDDPLSLTPCHVNVIPTNVFCPDWRYLLLKPKEGLELLRKMYNASWKVVCEQFLSDKVWKNKILKGNMDENTLRKHLCVGCNFPPSQYQLHLQFILPPFLPYQYHLYLDGLHFTYGRFFPFEYIEAVLELNEAYPVQEKTEIEDILTHYKV
eukprot:TRINITY_DN749_c0_g2_i5.p1 TRINITY_DN749_c0_g2~~TRINITY_DN749_c0_g2_i5.p1  ORF type:complete len:285 (-),score=45.28 TRINITY_DN749_c0_g2_i5:556-1410(-)